VVTPTIDVGILSTAHPGVDPRALEIAKTHGTSAANSMAGTLFPMAAPGVIKLEPIEMEIKVLSEHRLSMKTNNPNPNLKLNVDFFCGPRMRGSI
jgi:hypothetical protein